METRKESAWPSHRLVGPCSEHLTIVADADSKGVNATCRRNHLCSRWVGGWVDMPLLLFFPVDFIPPIRVGFLFFCFLPGAVCGVCGWWVGRGVSLLFLRKPAVTEFIAIPSLVNSCCRLNF